MKVLSFLVTTITLFACAPLHGFAAELSVGERLKGRILLQVESYGRAWYVNPADGSRYYLKDGATAFELMRTMGLGISNADLKKISTNSSIKSDEKLLARLKGKIVLQVHSHGEAWYVNPVDGLRYYLQDGETAYQIMRKFGLGISTANLRAIPMNSVQLVQDTTFDDVAYVLMRNGKVVKGDNVDQILPPASMTKLVTALVLRDLSNFDWNKKITISQRHLDYPIQLVGSDGTSEVDLRVGDVVSAKDLWIAMLVASSNQATIALVDSSGMTRAEFVQAMNNKAKELKLSHTVFYDPTGLEAHTVTTPLEMAEIANVALNNDAIARATRNDGYVIRTQQNPSRSVAVIDRNYSLKVYGADAAKTGFLIEAQRCVALKRGSDILIIMHARSMKERNSILDLLTHI